MIQGPQQSRHASIIAIVSIISIILVISIITIISVVSIISIIYQAALRFPKPSVRQVADDQTPEDSVLNQRQQVVEFNKLK